MLRLMLALLVALWSSAALAADKPVYGPPPAWVKDSDVPAPNPDEGGAMQVLLRDTQLRSSADGLETFGRGAIEIRTVMGLNALGTIAIPWAPHSDVLTIHHVRILRAGQTIDALAGGKTFTVLRREENLERSMLDGVLTATFQPADLRVGDVLDFAFTVSRKDAAYKGRNEQFTVNVLDAFSRKTRLRAVWPKDRPVRWRVAEGLPQPQVTKRNGETELLIEMTDVQPLEVPNSAPPRFSDVGYLEITEFASWREISAIMAEPYDAASVLAADSPLKAEVAKIAASSPDPKTRALAALRLVQDQVRYVYQGMETGFLPASADETWARRFGDCKGKSVLLVAVLRELGIDAAPALVSLNRSDALEARLPLMQRFDHVIVRAVIDGKVYWIDGARTGDRDLDIQPSGIHRWAVPIRKGGVDLERMPLPAYAKPLAATDLHLDASNGLDVPAAALATMTFTGDMALIMKAGLDSLGGADRQNFLREYWQHLYTWLEPKKTGFSYDDATGELRLTVEGEADMDWSGAIGRFRRYEADGARLGWDTDYERDTGSHADAPFSVNFPSFGVITETIVLPNKGQGFTVSGPDIDRVLGVWELKRHSAIKDGVFTMTASTRSLAPEIAYADMRAAEKPLKELANDAVNVVAPFDYKATAAEVGALDQRKPATAAEFIDRGATFLARSDLDKALADFNEALKLEPRSALAFANRGVTYFWKDDLDSAQADVEKALEIDPAEAVAYNGRGLIAAKRGETEKAIAAYTRAAELSPGSDFAPIQRAELYLAMGKYEAALGDLARIISKSPDNVDALSLRAQVLADQGKLEAALVDAERVVELDGAAYAHLNRGNVLLRLRRKAEARAAYETSLALEPSAGAYVGLSQVHEPADPAKAIADLEAALKLEPDLPEARMLKANWLISQDKTAEALALLEGVLKDQPDNRTARSLREDALMGAARYDDALVFLDEELAVQPADAGLLNRRCWLRVLSNEGLDAGLADCDAALKASPDFAAALDSRGWIHLRRGELDRAIADYDAALKLVPTLAASLFGRGIAKLRKGMTAEGEADLAAARKVAPTIDEKFARYGLKP